MKDLAKTLRVSKLLSNKKVLLVLGLAIAIIGIIVAVTDPVRFQILITSVSEGSFYALAALGIGLLFGVLRLINFAYGDWVMLAGYALILPSTAVTSTLIIGSFHPVLIVLIIIGFTVLLSVISEGTVFRPMRNTSPAIMMIASFALGYVLQNLTIMIYGGRPKSAGIFEELTQQVNLAEGVSVPLLKIITIGVTALLLLLLTLFLQRTKIGIQMRAAAEDFRMARMLGVRANFVIAMAFVISGFLASFVSLMYVTQIGILTFRMGTPIIVFAFIATVIGGMGSLVGSVVGGMVVGVSSVVLKNILPGEIRGFSDAFVFGLVIAILLARPQGLVPAKSARERV
ncbi:MAG: branched-chain amino acid ABC transporter permease [Rhodospirillaceae bacterium]|nr:branched-chain amino acid ABC transporter permease [Rhodospirillaceae bacterium]|tara:strand:- start:6482 stop:7510 length:1029 start_codon:yes stop_codon:yes gene_type:complete